MFRVLECLTKPATNGRQCFQNLKKMEIFKFQSCSENIVAVLGVSSLATTHNRKELCVRREEMMMESFNDGNNKLIEVLIVCDEWKIHFYLHETVYRASSPLFIIETTATSHIPPHRRRLQFLNLSLLLNE